MTQSNESKYFDLHTTGIGYLNRIREVEVRKGKPFICVTVAALHGSSDDVEYSYIDCKVSGSEAERLVLLHSPEVSAGKKVLVAFRIGDIWADAFTYTKGEKQGKPGASLKGRLLFISWVKVDGETVYQAKPRDEQEAPQDEQAQPIDSSPKAQKAETPSAAVAEPDAYYAS
jgi:hypothetical protein